MLAETRAELDDFHHPSKELEEELERELERTEKAHQELKVKVARADMERDEWKVCGLIFLSCRTRHWSSPNSCLSKPHTTLRQLRFNGSWILFDKITRKSRSNYAS